MKNISINSVIVGATSDSIGHAGIIKSTSSYTTEKGVSDVINWINKELYQYITTYDSSYKDFLLISIPVFIQEKICNIVCRIKKDFTAFPQANRYYDRLEYYYAISDTAFCPLDIVNALPEMVQYETENLDSLEPIEVSVTNPLPQPSELTKNIFALLLSGKSIAIQASKKTQAELVNALISIPLIYQKYLGFGFNIKHTSSNFLDNKLHIYTTVDKDKGIDLYNLPATEINKQFTDTVFAGKVSYPDIELQELKTPLTCEALYTLLNYHKLHYQVDKNENLFSEDELKEALNNYVKDFESHKNNEYIKERVSAIYAFCYKRNKPEWWKLADSIEDKGYDISAVIDETKQPKRDRLEKEKFESPEQAFVFLERYKNDVSEKKIKETVEDIGLSYLFKRVDKLLDTSAVKQSVLALLEKADLETKLQWKKEYKIFNELEINVKPTSDIEEFKTICNAFINFIKTYSSKEYQNKAQEFVQKSINLRADAELGFYQSVFQLAGEYNFTITIKTDLRMNPENIFEIYQCFNDNKNCITNEEKILKQLANDFIKKGFLRTVEDILDFVHTNQDFVKQYKEEIITNLANLCQNKKYDCLIALLSEIIKTKENLFLDTDNKLIESFKSIDNLNKKECFVLNKIKGKIKNTIPIHIKSLIDNIIINNIMESIINKRKKDKTQIEIKENIIDNINGFGNIIEYSTKSVKLVALVFISLFVGALTLNIYQFVTKPARPVNIQNAVTDNKSIIDSLAKEISQLQSANNKLQELADSLALQPYPNDSLEENDIKKLWEKGIKSDSLALGLSVDSVVKIIFLKNPNQIEKYYAEKSGYYAKLLIKCNQNCFDTIYNTLQHRDNLKIIPCFKDK
jgi:hypothetical protein